MMAVSLLLLASGIVPDCENPMAQQEMNLCAYRSFEKADAEMNAQWRATVAAMKEWDRQVDRSYDKAPGYHETLLAAQRAWLTYRNQHCLGAGFEARGGSMEPMLVSGCKAELTRERTRQLKSLVETEN